MKFSKLPIWAQLLAFVVIAGLIVFAAQTYKFKPLETNIADLNTRIEALQKEIVRGQAIERKLPQFEREVKILQEDLEKLKEIIPTQKEVSDLIRKIENLAIQSKLSIKNWQPGRVQAREFYNEWPISISVTGSYRSLYYFFTNIKNFKRLINVTDVRMTATDSNDPSQTISASFNAITYVYKD
jgi:type IV pilus assembly protein PilO